MTFSALVLMFFKQEGHLAYKSPPEDWLESGPIE